MERIGGVGIQMELSAVQKKIKNTGPDLGAGACGAQDQPEGIFGLGIPAIKDFMRF